jgi:hypothetical protein
LHVHHDLPAATPAIRPGGPATRRRTVALRRASIPSQETVPPRPAEGLDVPLSSLIDGDGLPPSIAPQVIRAGKARTLRDPSGVERTTLGIVHDKSAIEFVRFELPPRTVSGTFAPHRPGRSACARAIQDRVISRGMASGLMTVSVCE